MVAVEEQPRKPLCLDSDLGNCEHLPQDALHAPILRIIDPALTPILFLNVLSPATVG